MVSPLRMFSESNDRLASRWFSLVETDDEWTAGDIVGIGESQSFHVTNHSSVRGFAKPGFQGDEPRAAHEKIASDLAYLADVPVPPVVLWRNTQGAPFSISARAFDQPLNWDQSTHLIENEEFLRAISGMLAAGLVFHTWIGDTDHSGNGGNTLFDANSTNQRPAMAFIDHAFSLSYAWKDADPPLARIVPYHGVDRILTNDGLAQALQKVQSLSDDDIVDIVRRIPTAYLSVQRSSLVCQCLIDRRARLASVLGL